MVAVLQFPGTGHQFFLGLKIGLQVFLDFLVVLVLLLLEVSVGILGTLPQLIVLRMIHPSELLEGIKVSFEFFCGLLPLVVALHSLSGEGLHLLQHSFLSIDALLVPFCQLLSMDLPALVHFLRSGCEAFP